MGNKKILFVGDPLDTLNLRSDSSMALAKVALSENWDVFWCEPNDVIYFDTQIEIFNSYKIDSVSLEKITAAKADQKRIPFCEFDFCFVRKDPPFDEEYKDLCWILASQSKVTIVNSAEALLQYHEKSLHWKASSDGVLSEKELIPTCLSNSLDAISEFCSSNAFEKNQKIVLKPWLGHGGEDVQLYENKQDLIQALQNKFQHTKPYRVLIQPHLEEIHTQGDRRIIVAGGEIICHFVRFPQDGSIVSNVARGGRAVLVPMTSEQEAICKRLSKYLQKKSILFAGIDMIGNKIGEINITSPTGIRAYEKLTGIDVSQKIFHLMTSQS